MLGWLTVSCLVSLLTGILLLFSNEIIRKLGGFLNRPIAYLDRWLSLVRIPAGIILAITGGWIISIAFNYPVFWFLHLIGVIILFFGLLYLFFPEWLNFFSRVADKLLFSPDELVLGTRRGLGAVLIVAAVYILYVAYLSVK